MTLDKGLCVLPQYKQKVKNRAIPFLKDNNSSVIP